MSKQIAPVKTPEEDELNKKRAQLAGLRVPTRPARTGTADAPR
jgi:hypothetical protein